MSSRLGGFLVTIVLTALLVLSSVPTVYASTWLYYDDGSIETMVAQPIGRHLAVKFSLPSGWSGAKILKARYYIWGVDPSGNDFKVHILGGDGSTELLAPAPTVTPTVIGWFDVDLSTYDIVVSGDFYVTIEYLTDFKPIIGADMSSPDGRSYNGVPGSWNPEIPSRDLMIRAEVEQITPTPTPTPRPVGGLVMSTNKLKILTPYLALAGLIAAVSAVVAVKNRSKD